MDLKQLDKMVLLLAAADALEVEDFPEVGVASVRDMNQVGLDKGFWG